MLKRIFIFVLFVGMMGCASANTPKSTSKDIQPEKTSQNIPPSSKFSKVSVGMGERQVKDLIGQPNDIDTRRTMKETIPFTMEGILFTRYTFTKARDG